MVILINSSEVRIHYQSACSQESRKHFRHFRGRLIQGTGYNFLGRNGEGKQVVAVTRDKYLQKTTKPLGLEGNGVALACETPEVVSVFSTAC